MKPGLSKILFVVAIAAIALGGWALRVAPLLKAGAMGYPIDYDEGVYFSASALLFKGILPYRDFVFVHPPVHLYVLGAITSWIGQIDPADAFAFTRFLATVIGTLN